MERTIETFIKDMEGIRTYVDEKNDGIPVNAEISYMSDSGFTSLLYKKNSDMFTDKKIFKVYRDVPVYIGAPYDKMKDIYMTLQGKEDEPLNIRENPNEVTIVPSIIKFNKNTNRYYFVYYTDSGISKSDYESTYMIIDNIENYGYQVNTPFTKMDFKNPEEIIDIARPATPEEIEEIKRVKALKPEKPYGDNVPYKITSYNNLIKVSIELGNQVKVFESLDDFFNKVVKKV